MKTQKTSTYNCLYLKNYYYDCEFIINNIKYKLHKKFLIKSQYFKTLFNSKMKLNNNELIINDYNNNLINSKNIELLIIYFYNDETFNNISIKDTLEMLIIFDYLQIKNNDYKLFFEKKIKNLYNKLLKFKNSKCEITLNNTIIIKIINNKNKILRMLYFKDLNLDSNIKYREIGKLLVSSYSFDNKKINKKEFIDKYIKYIKSTKKLKFELSINEYNILINRLNLSQNIFNLFKKN